MIMVSGQSTFPHSPIIFGNRVETYRPYSYLYMRVNTFYSILPFNLEFRQLSTQNYERLFHNQIILFGFKCYSIFLPSKMIFLPAGS